MRTKHSKSVFVLAGSLVLVPYFACAETAGEACDRLATHSSIQTKPKDVRGVPWDRIDTETAMKSCAEAVASDPNVSRYHIQYGRALNKVGKNDQALAEFEIARKSGLWEANIFIGDMYFYGDFGAVDYTKAYALNIEAAENGIGFAANTLGIWYRDGLGTPKDLEKSLAWLRRAYELGDKNVGVDLGYAYENGLAVKADQAEALRLYKMSADAGNGMAMNNVGAIYSEGGVVPKDSAKAMVWFRKAEAEGIPLAYINIAKFTDEGTAVDVNHKLAASYVLKAFDQGDKWTDPFNRDVVFGKKWTGEFWREIQAELTKRGHYAGPLDGQLTETTKAAFEKIVDK